MNSTPLKKDCTEFLSKGLIFLYNQNNLGIKNDRKWQKQAALLPLKAVIINGLYY